MEAEARKEEWKCFVHEKISKIDKQDIRHKLCKHFPVKYEHEGENYCLLHYPNPGKVKEFNEKAYQWFKVNKGDYRGIYFPDVFNHFFNRRITHVIDFSFATFAKNANFSLLEIIGTANFSNTVFLQTANFNEANFKADVFFNKAEFRGKNSFEETTFFAYLSFDEAIFGPDSETFFTHTKFCGTVSFDFAQIKNRLKFEGRPVENKEQYDFKSLTFRYAQCEKPERLSFQNVCLQPYFFVEVDVSKFNFTNCVWKTYESSGNGVEFSKVRAGNQISNLHLNLNQKTERENLGKLDEFQKPEVKITNYLNKIVAKACWQLADNYEINKDFQQASLFREIANETIRLESFGNESRDKIDGFLNGFKPWTLHWWYWLSSFYGERWRWAFIVLLTLLLFFAIGYWKTSFYVCPKDQPCVERDLRFSEAVQYSFAIGTFQNIESRKPASDLSETLVILEKFFVPFQAALLALAVRRKFMR